MNSRMSSGKGVDSTTAAGGGGGADGDPINPPPDVEQNNSPMTFDEKRNLSIGINMLIGPNLIRIIKLIKDNEPSLEDTNDTEFEIDFNKLHPHTLRAMETFVKSLIPPSVYETLGEQQYSDDEI